VTGVPAGFGAGGVVVGAAGGATGWVGAACVATTGGGAA
jgi:hypothetical protein